eukprot:gene9752-11388_t
MNNNIIDKYRNCVGAVIFNEKGHVLIGRRSANKKTSIGKWQFPQGGIDGDEEPYVAVLREMHEEVGLTPSLETLRYVTKVEGPLVYLVEPGSNNNHIGQSIQWYLFYLPADRIADVNLEVETPPEFDAIQWHDFSAFVDDQSMVVPSKQSMFKRLLLESLPAINHFLIDLEATTSKQL